MAKKTVLDMVQDILNDMTSDEVNSITDTIESMQVAQILRTTYEEISVDKDWPELKSMEQLYGSTDPNKPTHMKLPENVDKLYWVKYDKATTTDTAKKYGEIHYKHPDEFINLLIGRKSDDSTVDTITDFSGVDLLILNDTAPTFYTSFDDEYLVFDSYDSAVEATLQTSKTMVYVLNEATWTMEDSFIPSMPSKVFPFLMAEAKSTCFNSLKQSANSKEEQKSRRQRTRLARDKFRTNGGVRYPNYGRN